MILTELPYELLEEITNHLDDNTKILLRKVCFTFYQAYFLKSTYFKNIPIFLIVPSIMKANPVSPILNNLCPYCPVFASYQHYNKNYFNQEKSSKNYQCYFHNNVHGNHNFSVPINGLFHLYGIFTKYHNIVKKIIKSNPIFKGKSLQFNYWYETPYDTVSLFGCDDLKKLDPLSEKVINQINKKNNNLIIIEIEIIYKNVKYLIYQLKREKDVINCNYPKFKVDLVN